MENTSASVAATTKNTAPVKAAIICLILSWVFALLPIPIISMMGASILNLASIILAIICIAKDAVKHGVVVLIGSFVITPILYLLGLGLMTTGFASALIDTNKRTNSIAKSKPQAQNATQDKKTPEPLPELAGKWKGHFIYPNGAKADFTLTLANPSGNLINGDMSEIDPNTKQAISSIISGEASQTSFSFKQKYSGQTQEAVCEGRVSGSSKQIKGTCRVGNLKADFSAKKETGWL